MAANDVSTGVRLVRVPEDRDGQRLDNFLLLQLKGAPRSLVYKLVRSGQVRINGKRAKADSRLVCDNSRATGSHRRTTKCQTVAERRRRMEADQDHLQRNIQNGIGPANN